ncbi:MAG: Tellurite resistance protein TerB [Alphaproteobacteria bacterium]|nr:MAG: Tellurite resistance protein TerB [Alphaproteobacteria bacterium]
MTSPVTPHDALIYVMVTMSAVDSTMTDSELKKIGDIVQTLPVFEGYDRETLIATSRAASKILSDEDGLDTLLGIVAEALPRKLHDTAYALAVEVAAVDLSVAQEELRFLQILRDGLNLDKLTVAALERSATARYRTL